MRIINPQGAAAFLLVCDHFGRAVPHVLGDLGIAGADWERHIAWDIGIAGVCEVLAQALDATCIAQVYSRLVIDCNRRPGHPSSIPAVSDHTAIPANAALSPADHAARAQAIFAPYHGAIAAELDRRQATGRACAVISMHSFTPVMAGVRRPWHAGVLHNRAPALSRSLARLMADEGLIVGDNEPYRLSDESDYTIPVHAEGRSLAYVELEIRQDLIARPAGQAEWAERLARLLPLARGEGAHGAAGGD